MCGQKLRKVKCWMGLMGHKSPCLLVLADEKSQSWGRPCRVSLARQVVISMGGENWLWETVPWQLCLLVKDKRIIFRAIGSVLAFRQTRMSNEVFPQYLIENLRCWLLVCQCYIANLKKRKDGFGSGRYIPAECLITVVDFCSPGFSSWHGCHKLGISLVRKF